MPKSRIYEIAQELNKTNKEVIEFLKEKKVEVKSHMSTLEEKDEKMVRDAFSGKNEGKEEKKEAADRPKKKSNLIQVFRPQNAQTQEGKNFRRNKPQSDRNGQDRPARGNGEGSRSGYQNRDNQNRDGQERRFNGQGRRDNQNRDGQSRDGQERRFNGQGRRDNQNRDGQSRDNQGGRRFDNRNGQNNNRYQGQNNRQDGGNGSRRFDGNRDGQNRDNQNRDNQGGRRFDNNRNGMNRDNRDRDGRENNGRRNERRDSRPAMDSMDLGLARKPVRDVKNKEKDKEKEREREEKKTQDRRNGQGSNRPNQGRFQKSRLPKALQKPARPQPKEEKKEVVKEITLPEKMTIRELAEKMKMQPAVIVKKLFMEGTMVTVNHEIDFEKAQEIALDYDIIAEQEEKVDVIEELLKEEEEDPKDLVPRPPVVCVMGHVDHGKTSLLDAIRKTNVTDREAGGITQHIGAYVVSIKGQKITFLDTPGHEAFTAMRMRGANSTDIAVLVVAADDGVMPQTVEAINHAKAAGVEIIVAINKVDKPSANIERVKQELSEYELIPEDWGGSTIFVPVSAKTHQGIEELLEMILLTSEVCELKANPKRKARGLVIEAQLDKGKGPVATILVQKGTLHVGDFIAAGASSGKVRAMMDDKGRRVKEAGPSTPVEILGLSDVPNAGEVLVATENDK